MTQLISQKEAAKSSKLKIDNSRPSSIKTRYKPVIHHIHTRTDSFKASSKLRVDLIIMLMWGWVMFSGHSLIQNTCDGLVSSCANLLKKTKGKVQTINILSPSAHIQGSSIIFAGSPLLLLCLHLLPSELSPYLLINQIIRFIPESWIINFFLSRLATKHTVLHTATHWETYFLCAWSISTSTP